MIPHHFKGQTVIYTAPKGHDHTADGEIADLPVKIDGDFCLSAWKPTADELSTTPKPCTSKGI